MREWSEGMNVRTGKWPSALCVYLIGILLTVRWRSVASRCGVARWRSGVASRCGVARWRSGVASRCGVAPGETASRRVTSFSMASSGVVELALFLIQSAILTRVSLLSQKRVLVYTFLLNALLLLFRVCCCRCSKCFVGDGIVCLFVNIYKYGS